jgi:hypothetical protein
MPRPFDPEALLHLPLMANLATLCDEGPRNAPVWFQWEEGALWMLADAENSSVRRVQRDPRCAVEIVHHDNAAGVLAHLGMRGRAEVVAMRPDVFRRLLARYLGPDPEGWNPWFIENVARIEDPSGRLIRLKPDQMFTNNVSFFRTGPALAWP